MEDVSWTKTGCVLFSIKKYVLQKNKDLGFPIWKPEVFFYAGSGT